MIRTTGDSKWEPNFIQECANKFKKNTDYQKRTHIGFKAYLSNYGTTSESECLAETFAECYNGENPREFATIFGT